MAGYWAGDVKRLLTLGNVEGIEEQKMTTIREGCPTRNLVLPAAFE